MDAPSRVPSPRAGSRRRRQNTRLTNYYAKDAELDAEILEDGAAASSDEGDIPLLVYPNSEYEGEATDGTVGSDPSTVPLSRCSGSAAPAPRLYHLRNISQNLTQARRG